MKGLEGCVCVCVCVCDEGVFGPAEAVNKHSDSQQDQRWSGCVCVCVCMCVRALCCHWRRGKGGICMHTHTHTHTNMHKP